MAVCLKRAKQGLQIVGIFEVIHFHCVNLNKRQQIGGGGLTKGTLIHADKEVPETFDGPPGVWRSSWNLTRRAGY